MSGLPDKDRRKLKQALERRYGQSLLPLAIEQWNDVGRPVTWRCLDRESGAFIIASLGWGRLRVIAESGPKR
jgi:hypothetical protein